MQSGKKLPGLENFFQVFPCGNLWNKAEEAQRAKQSKPDYSRGYGLDCFVVTLTMTTLQQCCLNDTTGKTTAVFQKRVKSSPQK